MTSSAPGLGMFQSTLPYRERQRRSTPSKGGKGKCFNPHSRTGSDAVDQSAGYEDTRFNPHSRTGSDKLLRPAIPTVNVSIHTPVQGATDIVIGGLAYMHVSIHTPVQGATCEEVFE